MARYYRSDTGEGAVYRVEAGISYWTGEQWVKAPPSVYEDFAEGGIDYDEISESEATRITGV